MVANQPPCASIRYISANTVTEENRKNMMVSVITTPREPEYMVNSV